MIDYRFLLLSCVFLLSLVLSIIRWFVIRKEYNWLSFLVVIINFLAFIIFLIRALY